MPVAGPEAGGIKLKRPECGWRSAGSRGLCGPGLRRRRRVRAKAEKKRAREEKETKRKWPRNARGPRRCSESMWKHANAHLCDESSAEMKRESITMKPIPDAFVHSKASRDQRAYAI